MDAKKMDCNKDLAEEIEERRDKIWKLYTEGIQHVENISVPESKAVEDTEYLVKNSMEVHKRAEEAAKRFKEILSSTMEENRLPQYLYAILEEQKAEASGILKTYDDIISYLNNDLNNKDREYREKCETHSMQHELIRKRIDEFVSELNRVGREEICAIRKAIVNHSQKVSDALMKRNDHFIDTSEADVPFDSYLWAVLSETISLKQLEDAFVIDQKETFKLRRKLLSEVCKLRKELEKDKLDYNLQRQVFEQEIFYLKENYFRNMPAMAKMKRKSIAYRDKKESLLAQLKEIDKLTKMKQLIKGELSKNMTKKVERYSKEYLTKFKEIFQDREEETKLILSQIYHIQKLIYKELFNILWEQPCLDKQENRDLPNICEEYWSAYLDNVMHDQFLNDITSILNRYRQILQIRSELKKKKENLDMESKELRGFLQNYFKLKKMNRKKN